MEGTLGVSPPNDKSCHRESLKCRTILTPSPASSSLAPHGTIDIRISFPYLYRSHFGYLLKKINIEPKARRLAP